MLKQLRITNIILVEAEEIDFAEGFNVLSGETGSGKSAIMNAISLIAGERSEVGMIRKGAEKGVVEAAFDIEDIPEIAILLDESGIDFEKDEDLLIKREISASGKSRAFINNQLAQASLLRAIAVHLLHIVGQHANQDLLSVERHREIVDLFGGIQSDVSNFSKSWDLENSLQAELDVLQNQESQRLREIDMSQKIAEELDEAQLKPGEEEELFSEYTLLAHAEEIGSKVGGICQTLNGERSSILAELHRQKNILESVAGIDASLLEVHESFQNAVIEIQEAANTLNIYQSRLEYNPKRLEEINTRLSLITRLKKKYGATLEEVEAFAKENKKKLHDLENADHRIEELQEQLVHIKEKNDQLALQLTSRRREIAERLSQELRLELASLNMPKVDFQIDVILHKRGRFGDNRVEFFLLPNVGEHRIPIKDCASGGELSRVMLSLQTVLSGKQKIPTLIFDEIDSNIGGETAAIVGEKLKGIGENVQVLCITHFPQVAKYADHHLQISKRVVGERTMTFVSRLDESTREFELARMRGE